MFPSGLFTPPSIDDWQFYFNGLTFGADTPIGVLNVEGLDLAGIRNGDVNWPRDHGQSAGLDVYTGRDVLFDFWMKTNGTSLQSTQLELAEATNVRPNEQLPLWFQIPNLPLLAIICRPRKRPLKIESDYAAAMIAKPELSLHATDPRIYSAGEVTVINLAEASGGLTFPVTFPVTFGSVVPATATIDNNGNTEVRPVITFTGPLTNPAAANLTIGGSPRLQVVNPEESGFTVLAGDQLVLDTGTPHLIDYYSGGVSAGSPVSVYDWLTPTSVWWDLLANTANVIQFSSSDPSNTGGTASIESASGYEL